MSDKCAYPKCGKELIHVPGRRKKKYCDQKCNSAHWQATHYVPSTKEKKFKSIPIEQWKEIEAQMELANIKLKGGAASGIDVSSQINDLTKPTNIVQPQKPLGTDKTNLVINTNKPERLPNESSLDYRIRCAEINSK